MKKEYLIGILIAVVILLAGIVTYLLLTREQGNTPELPAATRLDTNATASAVPLNNNQNKKLKTYQGTGFEFQYPADLNLTELKTGLKISHSVPYNHPSPCEFRGVAQPLTEINDLDIRIWYYPKTLAKTARERIPGPSQVDYLQGDKFKLSPGFIDEYKLGGNFKGYRITNAMEGCGTYDYYIPLTPTTTFFLTRRIVTEFDPINSRFQEYLKVPGIIPPEQEEKIFDSIVSSLNVK